MYSVVVFDLVRHKLSHTFHLVAICVAHLTSLHLAHLPLSVVEKILVQLSVCESDDNAGSAITCRQKELVTPAAISL